MLHSRDKRFGDIGASDALVQCKRQLELPNANGPPIRWPIQQKGGSNDRVIESTGSNRVLRTTAPEDGIALPGVQTESKHRLPSDPYRRHIYEASPEVVSPSCCNRVENTLELSRPHNGLTSEAPASNTSCDDHMADAVERRQQGLALRNIPRNDFGEAAHALQGRRRIPREDPDPSAFPLKGMGGM